MKSSMKYRSNIGQCVTGVALLLTLVITPFSALYAANESEIITNLSIHNEENNKQHFSLKNKKISKLDLLKNSYDKFPENPDIAAKLAMGYIQVARNNTDPSYYRLANKVMQPWAKKPLIPGVANKETPDVIRLVRATLSQHDHHYADANDDLLKIIQKQPRNAQAWLTLSTIQLVQGDYKKAQVSCSALSRVSSRWIASLCYSQLYSLTGSAQRAYNMQKILLSQISKQQTELRLWVTGLMGESALRMGDKSLAEQHFKAGIKIKNNDTYILRTYSEFLIENKRYKEVKKLLNVFTHDDQLLLRLAIASKHLKEGTKTAVFIKTLGQRFESTLARNSHIHGRDEALFLLEFKSNDESSKKRALKLAVTNWKTQKEPDDALILLRAAIANQEKGQVKVVFDWIQTHKLQDHRIRNLLN